MKLFDQTLATLAGNRSFRAFQALDWGFCDANRSGQDAQASFWLRKGQLQISFPFPEVNGVPIIRDVRVSRKLIRSSVELALERLAEDAAKTAPALDALGAELPDPDAAGLLSGGLGCPSLPSALSSNQPSVRDDDLDHSERKVDPLARRIPLVVGCPVGRLTASAAGGFVLPRRALPPRGRDDRPRPPAPRCR